MANYNTGMLVGAGTDVDFIEFPCNPMAEELELFCQMGLTSLQAIQCGTQTGARILGLENVTVEIREGLAADMIVVGGDPEQDIMDIKKIDETYVGGQRLFERGERPYYPVWKPEE